MSGDGDDKGKLPLFEFGKGRPGARGGLRPLPRRAPEPVPEAPAPVAPPAAPPPPAPPPRAPQPPTFAPPTPRHGVPVAKVTSNPFIPGTPQHGVAPPPRAGPAPTPYRAIPSPAPDYPFDPPRPTGPVDPAAPEVAAWLQSFLRTIKGRRLYPLDNPVLRGYLTQAHQGLVKIFERVSPLVLQVREDRLVFGQDAVLIEPDRLEGLPFLLFSHSIQQIEFAPGFGAEEVDAIVEQLAKDFESTEHVGEDLVTALWRSHLPHFDYVVIDIYNLDEVGHSSGDANAMVVDEETRRLREELGAIVGALRPANPSEGQGAAYADPLLADLDIEDETPEANLWDAKMMLRQGGLEAIDEDLRRELHARDDHDALLARLTDLVMSALRAEEEAVDGAPGWFLLLALLDAILRGRQFDEALRLIDRLSAFLRARPRPEDQALATRILQHLGSEPSVQVILQVIDTTSNPAEAKAGLGLLEHLGAHAYGAATRQAGVMRQPAARRQVVDLLGRLVVHDEGDLRRAARTAPPELFRDLLGLGETLPAHIASDLVWLGSEHADAGVRARAMALLRGFSGPEADALVARFMDDRDPSVRTAAFRAAGHRKSQVVLDALLAVLRGKGVEQLQVGELSVLMNAVVGVGGHKVTPILGRLLNESGTLGMSRHGPEVRAAAAHALGTIGSAEAKQFLQAGQRTLNRKVKQACKLALESKAKSALHLELPARFGALLPCPAPVEAPFALAPAASTAPASSGGPISALPIEPRAAAPSPAALAPPPLLDPALLRAASGVGSSPSTPAQTAPTAPAGPADGGSVLEAETVREIKALPDVLVDDLALDPPPARVAPPRLPTDALIEVRRDGEEDA